MIDLRRSRRDSIEVNITPLIDTVFLLLIFFLLTSHFLFPSGIPLRLPQAGSSEFQKEKDLTVSIDEEGTLFLDGIRIEKTLLGERLKTFFVDGKEKVVVIQSDRYVPMGVVVEVLDIIRSNGGERVMISTEPQEERDVP